MSEDEAREKLCGGPQPENTGMPIRINGYDRWGCSASACMMYRTYGVTEEIDGGKYTTQHGYCGLAGKP